MKKLALSVLLISFSVLSCVKTNNEGFVSGIDEAREADYSVSINPDLLIGKWQLMEIGTMSLCAKGHVMRQVWTKTATNGILEFANTGEFTKSWKNDGLCKGNFQVSNGHLVTNSPCAIEEKIVEMTKTELIFSTQDKVTRYKYTKL